MTTRRKPDESHRLSGQRSRAAPFIERAPLPIIEVEGKDHSVSYVNAAFCSLLGKNREELIGKLFAEIVPGGEKCEAILDSVYKTGAAATHALEDDSEPAHWLYAMWPALDLEARPVGVIIQLTKAVHFRQNAAAVNEALLLSALRQHEAKEAAEALNAQLQAEIAERKQVEEALRAAMAEIARGSRAKDDFLAALSHELRTPLTPVLMTAAALETDPALPLEVRDQLGMMRRNIELEARLIDDLLDITRISHGKLQIRPVVADLHQLLEQTAEIVRSDGFGKQVSARFDLAAARHHAMGDPARLQQVFWNIIKNALKFTPAGGSVTVSTRNDGAGTLILSVADTGVGIRAEALPHIFDAFEQGEATFQQRFGGLGLGLAISRAVVEIHGGAIYAESEGVGRGATFRVTFATVDVPEMVNGGQGTPPALDRGLRLLVVEDHAATLAVLTRLLTRHGHHVTHASNVRDGLAAAAVETFDAVISDLGLPDGTGFELMEKLRDAHGLRGIALSGYGMDEDVRRAREAGFAAHLTKPVDFAQLRGALQDVMEGTPSAVR